MAVMAKYAEVGQIFLIPICSSSKEVYIPLSPFPYSRIWIYTLPCLLQQAAIAGVQHTEEDDNYRKIIERLIICCGSAV